MFSLVRYGHCGRVHCGDEAARGFSTSHRDIFLADFTDHGNRGSAADPLTHQR